MSDGWLVAVNRAAGKRPVDGERVRRALAAASVEADVEMPGTLADMRRLLGEAVTLPRVAVVGGDGTVGLAVDAFYAAADDGFPILGVLPTGTGCNLLRTFGIPQTMEAAAHHLRGEAVYRIDVGEMSGSFGVRRFANVAQAGVGAAAVVAARRLPRRLGTSRYLVGFGMRLASFPAGEVQLTTERRTHTGRALAVIMANAQFFAGGWNIAPKATMVDGVFDLQVIDVPKPSAPGLVPKLVRGMHLREPGIRRLSAARFRLETERIWPVEVDGDFIGNTPVEGRVLPAAIDLKI